MTEKGVRLRRPRVAGARAPFVFRPAGIMKPRGDAGPAYAISSAGHMTLIRAAHDESGDQPRFFLSRRNGGYALKWPAEFSWIWVKRIT